ncbi:MAG: 2-oxoacid:ferredoxin oxidoreductase subunit beta [Dehalococcoidia bacterium]
MAREVVVDSHPADRLLRSDRLPHIWCPGCGLGSVMACYTAAVLESGMPLDQQVCVSGIGCTGRVAGYVRLDSYHTTHGRPIPFALGLKVANPDLQVTVISGDGDLAAIGGNHLIHAARRNVDLTVICVNNFNYGMTGGQAGPTTPFGAFTTTSPRGNAEQPFNLPYLVATAGAVFVARWTSLHLRQARAAIARALQKPGFSFVEILSPCPVGFGKGNDLGEGLDEMWFYRRRSIVDHDAPLEEINLSMSEDDPIVLGNFVDRERPVFAPAVSARARQEVLHVQV